MGEMNKSLLDEKECFWGKKKYFKKLRDCNKFVTFYPGTRSLMDRTMASDAVNAGSIPVECIFLPKKRYAGSFLK